MSLTTERERRAEHRWVEALRGAGPVAVPLRGHELLEHPLLNKDTAFTERERRASASAGSSRRACAPSRSRWPSRSRRTAARPTTSSSTSGWRRSRTATRRSSTGCWSRTWRSSCPSSTRRPWAGPASSTATSCAGRAGSGSRPRTSTGSPSSSRTPATRTSG